MAQTRILLKDSVLEQGEELLKVTRLGSLSELVAVMFSRYGKHLANTWEIQPPTTSGIAPEVVKNPSPVPELPTEFTFNEPISGL